MVKILRRTCGACWSFCDFTTLHLGSGPWSLGAEDGRRPWTQRSNVPRATWRRPGGRGGHLANAVCGSAVLRCCLLYHLCPLDVNTGNPQGVLDQRDRSQITQVIHVALLVCWSCHGSFVDSIHTFRYFSCFYPQVFCFISMRCDFSSLCFADSIHLKDHLFASFFIATFVD